MWGLIFCLITLSARTVHNFWHEVNSFSCVSYKLFFVRAAPEIDFHNIQGDTRHNTPHVLLLIVAFTNLNE